MTEGKWLGAMCPKRQQTHKGGEMHMNFGMLALGVWLILFGVFKLVNVSSAEIILAVWALVTGILVLVGR